MTPEQYLLDTNILIELFSKKEATIQHAGRLRKKGILAVSLLSVSEILVGWSNKDSAVYLPALYALFETVNINREIIEQAARWRREYLEHGITLALVDTLIAATAYHANMSVWTRNIDHFPMPEIRLYRGDLVALTSLDETNL